MVALMSKTVTLHKDCVVETIVEHGNIYVTLYDSVSGTVTNKRISIRDYRPDVQTNNVRIHDTGAATSYCSPERFSSTTVP